MKNKILTTLLIGLSFGTIFSQSFNKPKLYSCTQIPLKFTITKNNTTLISQATGQSSIPVEATEKDKFKFDLIGIKMEFNPDKNEMTVKQGGETVLFTKEK